MAPNIDPYRTLGLERGASLEDVKRAYRRLAKANHPDAAGEAALPRFLAIQAAYDQIAGPDARTRRPGGVRGSGSAARRPWEADPDRAGATHRAYGGRPRTRPGPRPRPAGPSPGPAGPSPGPRPGRSGRPDRPPNKATLGSTSYDGADAEPFDPDWGGASWYGTSSGTYWTLNPKEYADPRKHGPEYQARARRAAQQRGPENPEGTGSATEPAQTLAADAEAANPTPRAPTHTASSWWQTRAADAPPTARGTGPDASGRTGSASQPTPPPRPVQEAGGTNPTDAISTDAVLGSLRAWLDDRRPTIGARIGRAVIAWGPIALGIGWIAGELTGCGRFSATCSPAVAPLSWAAQLAVLGLLIAVTRLARIGAFGTIVTLAAVIPASVLLLATFDPEGVTVGRVALGGLMAIAWVVGVAYGLMREFRPPPIDRPVS